MSTTNSVKLVFHDGQTATEPLPVYDRDEIKSMTFMLGGTSVVLTKTSPSAVEVVVVHQLDQQPPPPPPPASEKENNTGIVVEKINHERGNRHSSGFVTEKYSKEMRAMLIVVATLFLQMAYQMGLNPPGGFWQDDSPSSSMTASSFAPAPLGGENAGDAVVPHLHTAGDPIMRSKDPGRYIRFKVLNSMSLTCSSVLILFLLAQPLLRSRKFSHPRWPVVIMYVNMIFILWTYSFGAVTNLELFITGIPATVTGGMDLIILYIYTDGEFFRGRRQNN